MNNEPGVRESEREAFEKLAMPIFYNLGIEEPFRRDELSGVYLLVMADLAWKCYDAQSARIRELESHARVLSLSIKDYLKRNNLGTAVNLEGAINRMDAALSEPGEKKSG